MTYDNEGRWTRTDRPELPSDRLGYPPEVGDADWPALKAAREARAEECPDCVCCTRDDCLRHACAGGSCPCTEG